MSIHINNNRCKFNFGDRVFSRGLFFLHGEVRGAFINSSDNIVYTVFSRQGNLFHIKEEELFHEKGPLTLPRDTGLG